MVRIVATEGGARMNSVLLDFKTAKTVADLVPESRHLSGDARTAVTLLKSAVGSPVDGNSAVAATNGFVPFPKIPRMLRNCVVTEKIDGTNAQIVVDDDGHIYAGSRTRIITPSEDNFGFARWVDANADELRKLGPGRHFGEWWGLGINRGYGLREKRFSLFNVAKWSDSMVRPACCDVVPVLYEGPFADAEIKHCVDYLRTDGSVAAPGFMDPEGVIVWHEAARQMFKITCVDDEKPKGSKE